MPLRALRDGEPFERYRVEALLGEGGMGQVYRAYDDRLRRAVALKIISAAAGGALGTDGAARLLREARAAAAIDHPNAVAIFDIGEVDGIPFLAMELVLGRTLRSYIGDREVPIALRMHWLLAIARALAAAHARGLVHRDIKPENVMVRTDGLVKVLDFGIARQVRDSSSHPASAHGEASGESRADVAAAVASFATLTGDSAVVGTPLYMSPEQIYGKPLDGRSDQFAWGVVAWELFAGRVPWPIEKSPPQAVAAILDQPVPPLRTVAPEVGAEIEALVARALEKEPARRFASTDALVAALERALGVDALPQSGPAPAVRIAVSPVARTAESAKTELAPRRRLTRALFAGSAALLLGALAIVALRVRGSPKSDDAKLALVASGHRPAIAVLAGGAPSDARLSPLPELIATELAIGDDTRVVPRDAVARALGGATTGAELSPAQLSRLRSAANAEYVVTTRATARSDGAVRLTLHAVAAEAASAKGSAVDRTLDGRIDALNELAARAGAVLRTALGKKPLSQEQAAALRASLPRSSAAAEAYADGVARDARYDHLGARAALERAVALDPEFALGHFELSRVLGQLGYTKLAETEAARALELSGPLGREQRLVIEAQQAMTVKDWLTAIDRYRTLFGFFPDNLDYGFGLVRAQVRGGLRSEAFATLAHIKSVPRSALEQARIDLIEAFVAAKVADSAHRLEAGSRARDEADAIGASWIAADARLEIAEAYFNLGHTEKMQAELDAARTAFEQIGDLSGLVGVLKQEAHVAEASGEPARAREIDEKALVIAQKLGDEYQIAGIINSRGIADAGCGAFAAAEKDFDAARAIYERIQDAEGAAHGTGNAAEMRLARGVLEGARASFEQALAMHTAIGMKSGIAGQTINVGYALYFEGRLGEAGAKLDDAIAQTRALGHAGATGEALRKRALVDVAQGDEARATRALDEARTIAGATGDPAAAAEVSIAEARLALDRGDGAAAVALARAAASAFASSRIAHEEALARAVLVRALVRTGALEDAAHEAEALAARMPGCELFEARIEERFARADLLLARADRAGAIAELDLASRDAEASQMMPFILEAKLHRAVAERGAARASSLASLAREAEKQGFARVRRIALHGGA